MEDIEQMRTRHAEEIQALQKSCLHKDETEWMPYMWAPGHYSGEVKSCKFCGIITSKKG